MVADVDPDPYTENPAPQSLLFVRMYFSLCSMKFGDGNKILYQPYFAKLLLYNQNVDHEGYGKLSCKSRK
jgi:hypothetical protein